ncbi:MAG: 16S rRNA (adenine(1518)-N(6)/adenine(1519)-N(6))-dimethyltransferase RsmA [Planctomycetota bacterium]
MSAEIEALSLRRIRAALLERGLRPSRKWGQNFLTDVGLLDRMVAAAKVGPDDLVLEVGPGPGTLTARLLLAGSRVVGVEVDPAMLAVNRALLGEPERLSLVQADILADRPGLPRPLEQELTRLGARPTAVVSNLPYQVASTFLVDAFQWQEPVRTVVTIQWEVAERILARPGSSAYGPLSALLQLRSRATLLRRIPPAAFWPRPEVDSACVLLEPVALEDPRGTLPAPFLNEVVKAAFFSRRKRLLNSLSLAFKGRLEKPRLAECLAQIPLKNESRGEQLSPMELLDLAWTLWRELGPGEGGAGGSR